MTLHEILTVSYGWANVHALVVFCGAVAVPAIGTLLAWVGRLGKTDQDGRIIASVVMAVAIFAVFVEIVGLSIGIGLLHLSLLDANFLLVVSPILCLVSSTLGIRLVFPLSELGSVRTAIDASLFVAACLGVVWLFSTFRGWGVVFLGSITELVALGLLAFWLLGRLYKCALGVPRH
jgi:hypothetical protein